MAYVFKHTPANGNHSPFYYAGFDYKDAEGRLRRVQKSTKTDSYKDALRIAKEWEDAARKGERGRLNLDHVRTAMEDLVHDFTGEAVRRYSPRSWVAEFIENRRPAVSKSSLVRYEQVARDFLSFLGKKANADIELVRERDVLSFRDAESKAGKAGRSVNQELTILSLIFGKAARSGVIAKNPVPDVEKLLEEDTAREPFTLAEVKAILASAEDEEWRGLITLGLYTGARLGDLASLRWEQVNLVEGVLSLVPKKTKRIKDSTGKAKKLDIPLHDAAKELLLSMPSCDDGRAKLFPKLAASSISGRSGLSRQFSLIMKRAGVDAAPVGDGKGKGRTLSTRSFHSLRHTFASLQANAGVSMETRMKLTGHSNEAVHAGYTHTGMDVLKKAVDMMPRL
jgi:integrase